MDFEEKAAYLIGRLGIDKVASELKIHNSTLSKKVVSNYWKKNEIEIIEKLYNELIKD